MKENAEGYLLTAETMAFFRHHYLSGAVVDAADPLVSPLRTVDLAGSPRRSSPPSTTRSGTRARRTPPPSAPPGWRSTSNGSRGPSTPGRWAAPGSADRPSSGSALLCGAVSWRADLATLGLVVLGDSVTPMTSTMGQVRVDEHGNADGVGSEWQRPRRGHRERWPNARRHDRDRPRTGTLLAVADQTADEVRAAVAGPVPQARHGRPSPPANGPGMLAVRDRPPARLLSGAGIGHLRETGKQAAEAVTTELMAVCETIDWYARNSATHPAGPARQSGTMAHKSAWKRYETPRRHRRDQPVELPFTLSMTPVITALFAGNTVVLKPSEVARTVGLAIGALFEDDTGDVVQVVTGGGATGEALVRSGVDKIVFTGLVRTGRRVMAAAADTLTPSCSSLVGRTRWWFARTRTWSAPLLGGVGLHAELGSIPHVGRARTSTNRSTTASSPGPVRGGGHPPGRPRRRHRLDDLRTAAADHRGAPGRRLDKGATILAGGSRLDRDGLWFPRRWWSMSTTTWT